MYYDLSRGSTNSIVELKGGTIETNVNDHIAMLRGMTDDTHEYLHVDHGILKGRPSISTVFSTIYLDEDYPDLQLGLVKSEAVSTLKEKVEEQKSTWKVVGSNALWLKPTTSTLHMQIKRPSATDTTGLFVAYIPLDAQGMVAKGAEVTLKEVSNTPVIDVTFEDLKPGTSYAIGLVNNDIYKASMNTKVYLGGGSTNNEAYTTGLPGLHIDGIKSIESITINGKKTTYTKQKEARDALNALFEVKYLDENGKEIKNDGNPGVYTAKVSLKDPGQTIKVNENEIHIVDGQLTVRHTTKADALTDGSATIDINKEIAQPVKQPQAKVNKSTTLYRGTIPVYDRDGISLLTDDILEGSQKSLEEKAKDYLKTESDTVMNQFEWRYLDLVDAKNGNEVITGAATIYLPYPKGLDANSEIRVLRMNGLNREYGMNKTSMDEAIAASTVQEMQINKLDNGIEVIVGSDEMGVFAVNWTVSKKNVRVHYIDQETNKEIEPALTVGFEEGTAFDVKEETHKAISGYTHVEVKGTVSGEQLTEDLDVYVYYKNQAPEILGAKDQTITVGDVFDPLKGVTVKDAEDGKLELTKDNFVSDVDTSKVGKYTVTYKIVDSRGKEATKTIHVTVNPKAGLINKAPTIDAKDQTITVGDAFDPMKGVTAKDAEDGDLTEKISAKSHVNRNKVGVYEVTYTVMDSRGATTTKTIQVTVQAKATVKPEQTKPNKQDGSNTSVETNVKVFTTMGITAALVGILAFFKRKNR